MITCPVCQQSEYEGELFCSKCGAQLTLVEDSPATRSFPVTQPIGTPRPTAAATPPAGPAAASAAQPAAPRAPAPGQIALAPDGADASIILAGKFEYFLGRESQSQSPPDVDLNPYGGREKGVSRRHASLRVTGKQILLMDLGSANGTKLNGEPVRPNEPVRLLDGDEIRLGKLALRVYFSL
jgi:pSer/pThr/pTyr-binding forkhead associated (FHA) protein